jgi:AcrR family transcriptional regulator
MSDVSIQRRTPDSDSLATVLSAAREVFAQFGVHRTRMEDIASAAGLKRQYLYRFISGREELVELALLQRCQEFSEELRAQAEAFNGELDPDLATILVSCVLIGRHDREFNYLSEAIPRSRLSELLTSSTSPVHAMALYWLAPVLDRARQQKRLRTDVDDDEIVDWLTGILMFLAPRDDLGEDTLRDLIATFALPSVLVPARRRTRAETPAKRTKSK